MTGVLLAVTAVLAVATAANLALLFAVVRRLRTVEASLNPPSVLPAVGTRIGEFRAVDTDGTPLTRDDLAGGPHLVAYVMPGCQPCHAALTALRTDTGFDRARTLVLVAGDPGAAATGDVVALADGLGRIAVVEPAGAVATAFGGVDSFPTLLSVRDGRVAASGRVPGDVRPVGQLADAG